MYLSMPAGKKPSGSLENHLAKLLASAESQLVSAHRLLMGDQLLHRKVWTFTQYINLNYVPLKFRAVFASVVALGWNAYIAMLSR